MTSGQLVFLWLAPLFALLIARRPGLARPSDMIPLFALFAMLAAIYRALQTGRLVL